MERSANISCMAEFIPAPPMAGEGSQIKIIPFISDSAPEI